MEGTPERTGSASSGGVSSSVASTPRATLVQNMFREILIEGESIGFKCNICKKIIQDTDDLTKGCPGRASHIERMHKTENSRLPKKRARKCKGEGEDSAAGDVALTADDVVCWMARRLHPHEELSDPFVSAICKKVGVTTKNILKLSEDVLAKYEAAHVQQTLGQYYTVSLDGGTNAGKRTMNFAHNSEGVERSIGAVRLPRMTADLICIEVDRLIEPYSRSILAGIVADNTTNVQAVVERVAKAHNCFDVGCFCHIFQLQVKTIIVYVPTVQACIDIYVRLRDRKCDDAEGILSLPNQIDSRWNWIFQAAENIAKDWCHYVANDHMTKEEVVTVKTALSILTPYAIATREVEVAGANIFDAVQQFAKVAQFTVESIFGIFGEDRLQHQDKFNQIFGQHVYRDAFVCACALFPSLVIESLWPDTVCMLREALMRGIMHTTATSEASAKSQVDLWMAGEAQHHHRNTVLRRMTVVDFMGECQLPAVRELFTILRHVDCHSASVERQFSIHGRVCGKLRGKLGETAVEVQLKLHSFLKAEHKKPYEREVPDLDHGTLAPLLDLATRTYRSVQAEKLQPGMRVKVYYVSETNSVRTRRSFKPLEYECRLIDYNDDELSWHVAWKNDRSTEAFIPIEDSWTFIE